MGPLSECRCRSLPGPTRLTVWTVPSRRIASVARRSRRRFTVRQGGLSAPLLVALAIVLLGGALAGPLRAAAAISPDEGEVDDLAVVPLDPDADPEAVLRARPFLIGPATCPTFCPENDGTALSEDEARDRLARFLDLRGLDQDEI